MAYITFPPTGSGKKPACRGGQLDANIDSTDTNDGIGTGLILV